MKRVEGIGGFFFRARDPETLREWYAENLGIIDPSEGGEQRIWVQESGPTLFAPFHRETEYFGSPDQGWMLNFRVSDLDAMLAQLRQAGADVEEEIQEEPGAGRFAWTRDPEGSRFELWEPA